MEPQQEECLIIPRVHKARAFGCVMDGMLVPTTTPLPEVRTDCVNKRDKDGYPLELYIDERDHQIALAPVGPTQLYRQARTLAGCAHSHLSLLTQDLGDCVTVLQQTQADASDEQAVVQGLAIVEPPSLTLNQYDQLVRALFWENQASLISMRDECTRVLRIYKAFGWTIDRKRCKH